MAQWLKDSLLPMQEAWVQSLVGNKICMLQLKTQHSQINK